MNQNIKELFNVDCTKEELVHHIIIYLRKSRKDLEYDKDEAIEKTLARHEKILQDWAINVFGLPIPEENIFREVVSGDTISDRPKMQHVLELIESSSIKGVLCVEIERLARGNTIDQGVIAQKFQITNTKILTPQKIFDLDNEFDLSFFEDGLYQSRKFLIYTKKILARGRLQSVKEGKCVKSSANWGYKKEKLKGQKGFTQVKSEENKYVKELFDIYLSEDIGITKLAHRLNSLSIPTPSSKSNQWTSAMVRSILNRAEFYAGYEVWNKRKTTKKYVDGQLVTIRPVDNNCLKVKALHEPTISEEELRLVQEKLKKASKKVPKSDKIKNPLANVVYCSFCGCTMKRRPYNKSYLKNGTIHEDTLICITPNCPNISSNLSIVENKIFKILEEELLICNIYMHDYSERNKIQKDYDSEIKALNETIKKLNNQKSKVCDYLEKELYDEDTFKIRINELNNQLINVKNQIKEIEIKQQENKSVIYKKRIPLLKNVINSYKLADIANRNELLLSVFEKISYTKTTKGGRWSAEAMNDIKLEYKLKI